MARITGVTTQTARRLVLDAGAIYLNYGEDNERLLGATNGGVSFSIAQDIRTPDIDGLPGPLAGTRRVTSVTATITAQLLEQTTDNIKLMLAGARSDVDDTGRYDIITRDAYAIPASAHVTNVAVVGLVSGTTNPIVCLIKNAIADGEVSFSFEDENEARPTVRFTGHFTADDLNNEPWEIRNPRIMLALTYIAGEGGAITGDATQDVEYGGSGTQVTATPLAGYDFVSWSDGYPNPARTDLNVHDDLTVTATFTPV